MGSGGSTARCGSSTSSSAPEPVSSSSGRRGRSRGSWGFQSSCLGSPFSSHEIDDDEQVCYHRNRKSCGNTSRGRRMVKELRDQVNADCFKELKGKNPDNESLCVSSNTELDDNGGARMRNAPSRNGNNSARGSSTQSLCTPNRLFSRFKFISGNLSSRLSRASSSRSLNAYPVSSSSRTMLNDREDILTTHSESNNSYVDRNEPHQGSDLLPGSHINRTPRQVSEVASGIFPTFHVSDSLQCDQRNSFTDNAIRDSVSTRLGVDLNLRFPRTISDLATSDSRFSERRTGLREPSERNVCFSRTLSVGRLRDRVLRRSSLSDLTFCPSQQQEEVRDASLDSETHDSGVQTRPSATEDNPVTSAFVSGQSPSSVSRFLFGIRGHDLETSRSREARYHNLLEHRSNFLERRRRIRSQVRALQRLGSRFENLSGHERSCILAGQNQAGRCTCHMGNRNTHTTDETNARSSISRIVMLAEALFEVLDEIHQRSVVLSSQPSVSSIGSVPAPNDVVDALPVKLYTKSQRQRNEEIPQCYICLVEYEEGDTTRVLPCHHEFHRTCVDKWLKEIHRVCPLCRGDICQI